MFCTIDDVATFLQIEITEAVQIAAVERAIEEVTEIIRNYCDQYISLVADDVITVDGQGGRLLYLPEIPVFDVTEVIEDGETLTPADDFILGQHGILHRLNRDWAKGVQNITVTYSHGYLPIPIDIVSVATRAASRAFQAGLAAADLGGISGVASYSLGDFSVSLQSQHGGGAGEGIMGASAARFLLMSEKDILNRYRSKTQ